ncbi:FAD-dependent oxidoreductase [Aquitalea sp.]|uniref:NAD(P)/FAD-dependent oxidoreductase n=1 Tax=Aquitalea sp. TaxID=1872623 RepID=UPI00258C51AC|nr:FAD-dependent oxidoreductase [Aquitalea sp.]
MRKSIAIIGAGIAGLSCAATLRDAGHHVVVFDKGRGLGGRLSTRRGEGWQADHGAQYFTARHPLFQQQVQNWLGNGSVAIWQAHPAVLGSSQVPAHDAPVRYLGVPGMSAPAKALAAGLEVHTSHTIQGLIHAADGWRLSNAEHGQLSGIHSQVVVALPSPQAASLLAQASPSLSTLAAAHRMLPCWTVMAQLEEPAQLGFEAAFVNSGPLRWLARNNSKPGRSGQECWVLQANAHWSAAHLEDDAASVKQTLLMAFEQLGGPPAVASSAHRWRYADCEASNLGSVWDATLGIGLCGDWLHGGKVEGAWLSGHHLANKILEREQG